MARDLLISDEAVSDLEDIWDYIAQDSPRNADRFVEQLYQKCVDIAELDGIGRRRDELSPGLYSIPHKKFVIFFIRGKTSVSVVRILRGSRDIAHVLAED